MSSFEIMPAIPADAKEIGTLRAHNWREQYANLEGVTERWMDAQVERIAGDEAARMRMHWIEQATLPNAECYWLVARLGNGALAGFLEARKYPNGNQELRSLHLAPNQWGLGIGQLLMNTMTTDWLDPHETTFLHVAQVNVAAQRFYMRPPNNYEVTDSVHSYGPIRMLTMERSAIDT